MHYNPSGKNKSKRNFSKRRMYLAYEVDVGGKKVGPDIFLNTEKSEQRNLQN
jgi:hypothetical protein